MDIWSEIKQTFKQGSIVTRLIYINIAVFLFIRITMVLFALFGLEIELIEWLALPSDFSTLTTRPWTLITYMFLHYNFIHIIFNLLWMYWFGKMFLDYFDEKKLLGTYFIGGIMGGLLYLLAYNFLPVFKENASMSILLGASASIIAIVMVVAIYAPNKTIHIFPLSAFMGPIKIIWIAGASILIYFIGITGDNAGGNIAHLGGALWGYIYILQLKKGNDITSKFNNFLFSFDEIFKQKSKMKVSYRRNETQKMSDRQYNKKKQTEKANINEILDKIGKGGYDSLSKQEKEILFKMGNTKGKPN